MSDASDIERERFEAWWRTQWQTPMLFDRLSARGDRYMHPLTHAAWAAWQASAALDTRAAGES